MMPGCGHPGDRCTVHGQLGVLLPDNVLSAGSVDIHGALHDSATRAEPQQQVQGLGNLLPCQASTLFLNCGGVREVLGGGEGNWGTTWHSEN